MINRWVESVTNESCTDGYFLFIMLLLIIECIWTISAICNLNVFLHKRNFLINPFENQHFTWQKQTPGIAVEEFDYQHPDRRQGQLLLIKSEDKDLRVYPQS